MQRLQPGPWGWALRFPKDFPASPQEWLFLSQLNVFIYVAWSGAREGLGETLSGSQRLHDWWQLAKHQSTEHPLLYPSPDRF